MKFKPLGKNFVLFIREQWSGITKVWEIECEMRW